jgi:hypothetical protein
MFLIGRHLVGGQLSANLRGRGRLAAGLLNRVDRGIDQLDVGTLRSVRRVFQADPHASAEGKPLSQLEIPFEPDFDQLQKIALQLMRSGEPVCEADIKR